MAALPSIRTSLPLPGASADRFLGWALPFLSNANSNGEAAEVALLSLHEFLMAAELPGTERYIPSVLRSCQALLEDEGTPLKLLRPLLGILTVLAGRFSHIFQPHFADLVDLLLGWALMPALSENDRCLITDTFLHFQSFWAGNLPFSSNLLFKFLGDMEVLAHDAVPGSVNQPKRLWALMSCFVAVLRATTSGILELGLAEDSADCFQMLMPRFLACLGMVGQKFRSFKWLKEAAICLSFFANLFRERFSKFACLATDFLLTCLEFGHSRELSQGAITPSVRTPLPVITSSQVQEILKVNLDLLSVQGLTLPPNVVKKLLQAGSAFSRLRLHSNFGVTGMVSQISLFLLGHDSEQVMHAAVDSLFDELVALKSYVDCKDRKYLHSREGQGIIDSWQASLSETELCELIKYDLLVLTCAIHSTWDQDAMKHLATEQRRTIWLRVTDIIKFLLEQMNPFESPLQYHADVQFALVQALHRLCCLECGNVFSNKVGCVGEEGTSPIVIRVCISDCSTVIAKALHASASFAVKIEALDWLGSIASRVLTAYSSGQIHSSYSLQAATIVTPLSKRTLLALMMAAADREPRVRGKVAITLEMIGQAMLIDPHCFHDVVEASLEQLGDLEPSTQASFRQVLAVMAPACLWTAGQTGNAFSHDKLSLGCRKWKQVFALKRFSRHLRPQQVVSILNFIAQQWQVLPAFWLQRLIQNFPKDTRGFFENDGKGLFSIQDIGAAKSGQADKDNVLLCIDFGVLERICASNNLASAWWAIQEAAWHCVAVRLRTHLGGPTQTFGVLERMILDVVQHLQADGTTREAGNTAIVTKIQLFPMRLLVEFVDALKKNIHNASEGSIALPVPTIASAHFFRANRKVCEEWFARICEALMNASLALECHVATFHHAALRLHDLRGAAMSAAREIQRSQVVDRMSNLKSKLKQDLLKTLRVASLGLCRAHDYRTILGLQSWSSSTFGSLLLEDTTSMQTVSESLGWMTGMAMQAQGHYESAAASFSRMFQSDDALSALGADGVQFLIARTIESYVALADWEALESWLQELQTLRAVHAGKVYAGALTTAGHDMNAIHALACFDSGDLQGAWGHLDLTPQTSGDLTPDPRQALQRSEQMLLQALLRLEGDPATYCLKEIERAKLMLEEGLLVSGLDGLKQAASLLVQLHCIKAFEAKCNSYSTGKKEALPPLAFLNPLTQVNSASMDALYQDCMLWVKVLRIYKAVIPQEHVTAQLRWQLIGLARKKRNFRLCHGLLQESSSSSELNHGLEGRSFERLDYEKVQVKYAEENSEEAVLALWDLVEPFVVFPSKGVGGEQQNVMIAKACLKFVSWIKQMPSLPAGFSSRKRGDGMEGETLQSSTVDDGGVLHRDTSQWAPQAHQEVIGAAIKSAALLCPTMGKAWYAYGMWCFNLAQVSFSNSSPFRLSGSFPETLNSEFAPNSMTLSAREVEAISAIIWKQGAGESALGDHMRTGSQDALIQQLVSMMQMAAGAVESNGESPSGMLSLQLRQEILGFFHGMAPTQAMLCVTQLMDIWWALRRRRVSLYEHALQGFLKHLSFSNCKDHGYESMRWKGMKQHRQDHSLSSSLHMLHILFNHGVELDDALRKGLTSISHRPWQEITVQLFARLTNHPEPRVRQQLDSLLITLAQSSPWAIVYSVLVNMNASDGEPPPELQELLGCLLKRHPKLVKDVQLLIAELGGITVLWEERWLSTLQDLHADVTRNLALLKDEALRLAQSSTLAAADKPRIIAASYSAAMSPVILTLERTMAITSRPPATSHEVWFQEQYGSQLRAAMDTLKAAPSNLSSIMDVWRPFDDIVASLARHVKKSVIPLANIAPRLSTLGLSDVPMPGLEEAAAASHEEAVAEGSQIPGIVTVTAFDEHVQVLATKTKPKKLTMLGSDGQAYTYLLKGHEDLRLDARVMQLLRAINGMLLHHRSTRGKNLAARYYSVTPISGQAGLIQWVDNLVSMYAVFKAWQQRTHTVQFANDGNANPPPTAVPRPSDMFYGKMLPALKERGLRKVSSRRDWPLDVKRKVLLELMKETPRQLLYKELWCASDGLDSFHAKLQRFSGSVAVMSMVGHILGLGDRHLDNILVDFRTGDILHIDYNVCFEKGLRLKIPEIVPFRLTQTVQATLGLTGVEGLFRQSCESVMETLRQNKDVILMILDVFVWDPLTEWTKSDSGHEGTVNWQEDKNGVEGRVPQSLIGLHAHDENRPLPQEPEIVIRSPEARSQEDVLTSGSARLSPAMGHSEQPLGTGGNLSELLDGHIVSQAEDDCWISPPNSDLPSPSDKEAGNRPLESFWLQSTDSLSGSRLWQSTVQSDPQEQNDSEGLPNLSTLVIQEERAETSLLQLCSQGDLNLSEGMENAVKGSKVVSLSKSEVSLQSPMGVLHRGSMDNARPDDCQTSPASWHSPKSYADAPVLHPVASRPSPKRNAYAASVLEKIEWKLNGLDNESRRHSTVSDQVDYLLRQAMSIDNLCNMYEGWTPWI